MIDLNRLNSGKKYIEYILKHANKNLKVYQNKPNQKVTKQAKKK